MNKPIEFFSIQKPFKKTILLFLLSLFVPLLSWGGEPTDRIRSAADRIISVISDESMRPAEMKDKRDWMIMEIVDSIFNWEEFSRRALATNWNKRTIEEKKEFVTLLRQLIVNNYIDYATRYSGENLIFLNEKIEGFYGNVAGEVIISKGTHIPINFRVIRKAGLWWVYDINVEGLSFAGYYRSQINAIITGSDYEELLKRLKEKANAGTGKKDINK
jgi:phospholipid transport system substrate-binding protein